jgi:NitT/TauT family transport system substrate-binding protein
MIRIGSLALALGVALSAFATPAAAQTKQKVTLAGAPVALPHWFPIYVAAAKFFDEEGLEADWVGLNSGAAQLAAIMGGSATVAPTGIEHIINSYAEGGDIVAFTTLFDAQPNSVVLSKEAMAKAGITESMPLDEKIKRMKGLKIGITGAGGGSDLYFRAILKNRGIEPDQFLTLQPLGNPNAMYGAFEKKLVDGFVMSAPIDDKAAASGIGVIAINALTGEVPEVKGVPYTGMLTTRRQLDANRPLYVKITRAVTKAIKYIKENPEGTREVWKPLIPNVDPAVFDTIMKKYMAGSATSPVITREQYAKVLSWYKESTGKDVQPPYEKVIDTSMAIEAEAAIMKGKN